MPSHDFRKTRLFVDTALESGMTVTLERDQSNYLGNVLRLKDGDSILVFNGRDGEWLASISGRKRLDGLEIESRTRPQDRLPDLAYVFAPLKHARLDYMVQKAVEMGVSSLQPVLTRFTQVARVNGERMRANVIEAAEQCGILGIAEVAEPVAFDRFLSHRKPERLLVFCDEAADVANPLSVLQGNKATGGNRRPDRARRRVCRGGARRSAASAEHTAAFARPAYPAGRYRRRRRAGAGTGGTRGLDRTPGPLKRAVC